MGKIYQGEFFREILLYRWSEFLKKESSGSLTVDESLAVRWVRACVEENFKAIKQYVDRIDGKEAMPVRIIYPKVYITFPHATDKKMLKVINNDETASGDSKVLDIPVSEDKGEDHSIPSLKDRMREMRQSPEHSIKAVIAIEKMWGRYVVEGGLPKPEVDPQVQTVISAHLIHLGQEGDMSAIEELMDRFYGKVEDKIKVVGEDIYISHFSSIAPANAELNQDGVYQIEAPQIQKTIQSSLELKARKRL